MLFTKTIWRIGCEEPDQNHQILQVHTLEMRLACTKHFVWQFTNWRKSANLPERPTSYFHKFTFGLQIACNHLTVEFNERADAQNSTIRQAQSGIQAERPHGRAKRSRVRNDARIGEGWPSYNFGSDRRDTGGPGCGEVSRPLRSRQHQAQELPVVYPRVDQATKRNK